MRKTKKLKSNTFIVLFIIGFFIVYLIDSVGVEKIENNKDDYNSNFKFFYTVAEVQERLGIINNAPYIINENGRQFILNSDGLRERFNYTREKPENTFRIGVFGPGVVDGPYVNTPDIFTEVLEDRLNSLGCSNKFEVINFGVGGYDVPYTVEMFNVKGQYYNSDINIFFINIGTIEYIPEVWWPILNKNIDKEEEYPKNYTEFRKIELIAVEEYESTYKFDSEWLEKYVGKPFEIINNKNKGETIIFTINVPKKNYIDFIKEKSKEHEFAFFSFEEFSNDEYYDIWEKKFSYVPIDTRPNKLGHEFLAKILYIYIISNYHIGC